MERQRTRKAEVILKEKNKMREFIYPISRLITKSRFCVFTKKQTQISTDCNREQRNRSLQYAQLMSDKGAQATQQRRDGPVTNNATTARRSEATKKPQLKFCT